MAKNRHFLNQEEIFKLMSDSGFSNVTEIYSGDLKINPLYLVDLNNDPEKIKIFNSYVRKLLPERIKRQLQFKDNRGTIQLTLTKKIFAGVKNGK